ncbi:MerR family transcriptional regulator [Staphylococcus caeli]|uniref:Transcriptional regulator, MarR family protein n=1 Tax=Staphylococcus caeli TaxID=2201815 RepID=A0A1D4RPA1_9STAP|nr:MerR family transcriptional regulator [Staphylococcus caeli]SCS68799.1 transcriptional regulator, MarR family protein [Staphylococcus caeli]SCT49093.1 transcriptional regulator, MarR family protein [Staphylococcus caeli]
MNIDEVAKRFDISKSQIRYYEKLGLLNIPRDDNNYRNFNDDVLFTLQLIIDLKALDIELQSIKYIIHLFNKPISKSCNEQSNDFLQKLILEKEAQLNNQIYVLQKLKKLHNLAKDEQYETNKNVIFQALKERGDNYD